MTVFLVAEARANFGRAFCARLEWRSRLGTFRVCSVARAAASAAAASAVSDDEAVTWAVVMDRIAWCRAAVKDSSSTAAEDPHPDIQGAAAYALIDRHAPGVTRTLRFMLLHYDPYVRESAIRALAGRGRSAVINKLMARLADRSGRVRRAAALALADRDSPAVADALLNLLNDPQREVRRAAVQALRGQNGSAVTDKLLALLDHPDVEIENEAARALADRDGSAVTDRLFARLTDPGHEVKEARPTCWQAGIVLISGRLLALTDHPSPVSAERGRAGTCGTRSPGGHWQTMGLPQRSRLGRHTQNGGRGASQAGRPQ